MNEAKPKVDHSENYRMLAEKLDFTNRSYFVESLTSIFGFDKEESETFLWILTMWEKKRVIPIEQIAMENIRLVGDNPECNWPEDYDHENGHYQNKCVECGKIFFGNKHRIVCKKCTV